MGLSSTYPVQDRSNQEELKRLAIQDHMLTAVMGGVLPEQEDPTRFRRVLDIGCGPGGWILAVAQEYPQIERLFGIDISTTIINYAREQAEQKHIPVGPRERIEFHVMDALRMLEFPEDFFDLVNFRLGVSFMRQWDWPKLFSEMRRVLKVGGVVRIVEVPIGPRSKSEALTKLYELFRCALFRSGHLFREEPTGLIDELPGLLMQNSFQKIELHKCEVEYRAGTEIGDASLQDNAMLFRTFRPFFSRYGCLPGNYDHLYQQAVNDLQQQGFIVTADVYTIWAINQV
jgi:ubiquinone/menaquinone biosynthesis C-methylase UbiE